MNLSKEKSITKKGYRVVAGLDEAGRGAWAGPIVAAAVVVLSRVVLSNEIKKIKDSKKLTAKQREKFFNLIKNELVWSLGVVSVSEINQLGLRAANLLALKRASENLKIKPDFLLIDYFKEINSTVPSLGIKFGDDKVFSIAAASVVAKVSRDRLMEKYHQRFPEWHFNLHKGYGTKLHRLSLKKHGLCSLHRKNFKPIQNFRK